MLDRTSRYVRKWNVLPLLVLTLAVGLSAGTIFLSRLINPPATARLSEVDASPLIGESALVGSSQGSQLANTDAQPQGYPRCPGAFQFLWPQPGAPSNGGTVHAGDKFAFDLMTYAGPNHDAVAQQAYLSFTYTLLQNVSIAAPGCVLTETVAPDATTFDATLQNEVCNNPSQICIYRGYHVLPGHAAYASGALDNPVCQLGCGGNFRVAEMGFCALAPGQALIRWHFTPVTRHSEVVTSENIELNPVNPEACYEDYVINIAPSAK